MMTDGEISTKRFKTTESLDAKVFFDKNGYVIIRDFFDPYDLAIFKEEVKNVISAYLAKAGIKKADLGTDEILSQGILLLEDVDHEYVAAVYDTIFQIPSFFRIIGNKQFPEMITTLLGTHKDHPLYGFTNRCRIDPPVDNRRTYGWHQEVFYTIPKSIYIQTWAPLIFDNTLNNGTIEIAAGSHKEGIAKQKWNEIPGRATQIIVDDEVINKYPQGALEMKVGEMLFFSGQLAHRSGNNTSSQIRYSLVGMYHDVYGRNFMAPKIIHEYRGITAREYYDETFKAAHDPA